MATRPLYRVLASTIDAYHRCNARRDNSVLGDTGRRAWQATADERDATIERLCREHMPSGSGFDSGTTMDTEISHGEWLVFHTSYHAMNEHGCYIGWTDYTITVTGSLIHGITVDVDGPDNIEDGPCGMLDYIGETFDLALRTEIES